MDTAGKFLVASEKIGESGVQNGDALTFHISQVRIQSSERAFAARVGDGSIVTWGTADHGGDSSAVQEQIKDVQQIQATMFAFAAILDDGSVVSWGDARFGGDSSAIQDDLKTVLQIQATNTAFAAILGDGSVITWG